MVEVGKYTPLFNGKLLEFELVSNLAFTLTADLDSTSCFKENKIPLIDLVSVKYLVTLETSLANAPGNKEPPLNRKSSSPRPLFMLPSGIGLLIYGWPLPSDMPAPSLSLPYLKDFKSVWKSSRKGIFYL